MENMHVLQQKVDEAFVEARRSAADNGASFMHATDQAGMHSVIERYAPAEYFEYKKVLHAAKAALRGTKYEGCISG